MTTRSMQCIATARLHNFRYRFIAILCLPCDTIHQKQQGVGKEFQQNSNMHVLLVASILVYNLQEKQMKYYTCVVAG